MLITGYLQKFSCFNNLRATSTKTKQTKTKMETQMETQTKTTPKCREVNCACAPSPDLAINFRNGNADGHLEMKMENDEICTTYKICPKKNAR